MHDRRELNRRMKSMSNDIDDFDLYTYVRQIVIVIVAGMRYGKNDICSSLIVHKIPHI